MDFAILPELNGCEELQCEQLFEEELLFVTKSGSLDASYYDVMEDGSKIVKFDALKDQKFILLKNGHGMRDAINVLFGMYDYEPDIFMETTNNETAFRMATARMGVTIVPEMCINTLKQLNEIDTYKLSENGLKWKISAVFRKNSYVNLLVKECISAIREMCGDCSAAMLLL